MLTEKQILEIKEHLEKAQKPVIFYDNDADGLCSFLLLARAIGRGKGVAVKSYPDLNVNYARRIHEFNSDYVFVLDKPAISHEFLKEVDSLHIPLVWIDHHAVAEESLWKLYNNVFVYNPALNKGKEYSTEPVTYLLYKLLERPEDIWIAMMGCVADHFLPDFTEEFAERYPELWKKGVKKPFDAYYGTEIGKLAQAVGFGIKDSITHVTQMQSFLISCKGPSDMLSESSKNASFRKRVAELRKKYDLLLDEAKRQVEESLVYFEYGGDLSISSEIANELMYTYPDKTIIVGYKKGAITNLSLRGKGIRVILEKVLSNMENATGGGHEDAVGARVRTEDLKRFKELLLKEINHG
jgi:single-stranded DNA-specific DHH superfamily exonuclease